MKTIKIIDLLNKIANGESLPKAINSKTGSISYYLYDKCGEECDDRNLYAILNDEAEIIEEDNKIEKIKNHYDQDLEEYVVETFTNNNCYKEIYNSRYDEMIIYKINELIDEVNKLKEERND